MRDYLNTLLNRIAVALLAYGILLGVLQLVSGG